jgi:predicted Ser/Thr protein kinase
MLIGQQVGPFVIDKELGSGAMGAVYRGRYTTKKGVLVAIKVMAPGLGTSNSRAAERFEREAEILKQLNHPNIVRLFAVGKHQGVRYIAMEYLQGESLDKVMARRGRMSWEEVVELGQQLCLALQHAHQKGIIHRDLKPSNLMVLPDGTLKLTDFGIAKDTDVTQLTSANCTVGTAAYMSPEQCKGERNLSHKSDLYSLGVLLYELITGRKPFNAENAMEMFMLHVQGTFPRPAKLVMELPVWLDTLICQLLEKKPENRPLDAAMVYNALGSVKEKVEAQQSAGVDVARRRMIDRAPGAPKLDAEDKETARFLLKGKMRPPGRKAGRPFYEKAWFQAAGILTILAGLGLALYFVFRPPSPDKLYAAADRTLKSIVADPTAADAGDGLIRAYLSNDDHRGKLDEVRDRDHGAVGEYLRRYEAQLSRDPRTKQMRQWADAIDCAVCERQLMRHLAGSKYVHPEGDLEKLAFAAADAEKEAEKGDKLREAIHKWQQVKEGTDRAWTRTAERHLPLCVEAARVLAYEKYADLQRAKALCDRLEKETSARPEEQEALFAFAHKKGEKLAEEIEKVTSDVKAQPGDEQSRKKAIAEKFQKAIVEKLTAASQEAEAKFADAKYEESGNICQEIIDLYDGSREQDEVRSRVRDARDLQTKIRAKLLAAPR